MNTPPNSVPSPKRRGRPCDHQWLDLEVYPDIKNSPKDGGCIRHNQKCKKCGLLRTIWGVYYD